MQAPLCFASPKMFGLWLTTESRLGVKPCDSPCVDCTPSYQTRMKKQRRCAHPETMFSVDKDGGVYGYWPS